MQLLIADDIMLLRYNSLMMYVQSKVNCVQLRVFFVR